MICLDDLIMAKGKNCEIIKELEIENRVFDKLIAIEKSKIEEEQNIEETI